MNVSRGSMLCSLWGLLLLTNAAILQAQSATSTKSGCFTIHAYLNGERIGDPQVITLKARQIESTLSTEGSCFKVSPTLITEKAIDVSFTVRGNRVHLSAIPPGFFAGPWDIYLEDKEFGR